ncbi:restriction endonuclease subunit S [Enterococcus asini]|nr:restriction endonuclease subunit S [Enterococcus asini]MDT2743722.1 restriction endonuclease subunit S [Enterococcus asini]
MLFGKLRPYLQNWLLADFKGIALGDFWVFDTNKHSSLFVYYLMQSTKYQTIANLSSGTKMPRSDWKTVSQTEFSIPKDRAEEYQIGILFENLDSLITLHQQKYELLIKLKKAYLQLIFPKTGESTPKVRFADFHDNWEQRKLNEISDIYDGTHQTPKYQDEGVMFLSVENIKTLISNKFISHEAFESEFRIRPQRGDVLITRIGDVGTANVVETDENLAYYVSLALLKSEKLKPYFLQSSIQSPFVQKQIWKRTLHIAFPKKINKNEIGQVPINIPTTDEQVEIGTFFKHLDDAITLHQQKIASLKSLKQAYLQKMFV